MVIRQHKKLLNFIKDKINGEGKFIDKNAKEFQGSWKENDKFIVVLENN